MRPAQSSFILFHPDQKTGGSICRLTLAFCLVWILGVASSRADDKPSPPFQSIDIGMPAPRLHTNDAGTFVVCDQYIQTPAKIRVVVVDANRSQIAGSLEFEHTSQMSYSITVGQEYFYILKTFETKSEIVQVRLSDLKEIRRKSIDRQTFQGLELFEVQNQALLSNSGTIRLSLPELADSMIAPPSNGVRRVQGGWRMGNLLYDNKLQPVMPLAEKGDYSKTTFSGVDRLLNKLQVEYRFICGGEHPVNGSCAAVLAPQTNTSDRKMIVKLIGYEQSVLDEMVLGPVPPDDKWPSLQMRANRVFISYESSLIIWEPVIDNSRQYRVPMWITLVEPRPVIDYEQPSDILYRAVGGVDGIKFRGAPLGHKMDPLPDGKMNITPKDLLEDILKLDPYHSRSGGPSDPTAVLYKFLISRRIFQEKDVAFYAPTIRETFRYVTGRTPKGIPIEIPLKVVAEETQDGFRQSCEMSHVVYTEIPESLYGPLLKYKHPSEVPNDLETRKESLIGLSEIPIRRQMEDAKVKAITDRENAIEQAKYRAEEAEADRRARQARIADEERTQKVKLSIWQDRVRPWKLGVGLLVSMIFAWIFGNFIYLRNPTIGHTKIRGVLMALPGLLPVLLIYIVDITERRLPLSPAPTEELARMMATILVLFGLLLTVGIIAYATIQTGVDRGLDLTGGLVAIAVGPVLIYAAMVIVVVTGLHKIMAADFVFFILASPVGLLAAVLTPVRQKPESDRQDSV